MKSEYLNPIADSLVNAFESMVQITPKRGSLSKIDTFETNKAFALMLNFEGDLSGFFSVNFDKEVGIQIVNRMTGGMGNQEEIDEMGESCLTEIAGVIKGGAINELAVNNYNCNVNSIKLFKKTSMPFYPPMKTLKVEVETEFGDIEILISLSK